MLKFSILCCLLLRDYGFFDWTIPEVNTKEGKIKITSIMNDDIKDENEKAFELNAKPLTIFKSPLIGAKWMPYATQLIRWESFNMPSDYINIYISYFPFTINLS